MNNYTVIAYEKENGQVPIEEFLDSLDIKMRAKVYGMIGLLQEKGNQLREPYSKHVDDGIFELRCKLEPILPEYCISFTMIIKLFLQMDLLRKLKRLPGRKLN
jgi:phage-related protein